MGSFIEDLLNEFRNASNFRYKGWNIKKPNQYSVQYGSQSWQKLDIRFDTNFSNNFKISTHVQG